MFFHYAVEDETSVTTEPPEGLPDDVGESDGMYTMVCFQLNQSIDKLENKPPRNVIT